MSVFGLLRFADCACCCTLHLLNHPVCSCVREDGPDEVQISLSVREMSRRQPWDPEQVRDLTKQTCSAALRGFEARHQLYLLK